MVNCNIKLSFSRDKLFLSIETLDHVAVTYRTMELLSLEWMYGTHCMRKHQSLNSVTKEASLLMYH